MTPATLTPTKEELHWYSQPGVLTDVSSHADRLQDLPEDLASLCGVVQGVLLHGHLGALYGLELAEERLHAELNLRSVDQRLAVLLESDDSPLVEARPPAQRQLGTCRDFTLLLCALLRWQGRAARARCGFGSYFTPGRYEDHWVCEVWDEEVERWRLVDAQIDDVQRRVFGPKDPLDVSRDEFIAGGEAWEACRSGHLEPSRFGLSAIHESGLWFVCGDFVRDVAALNRVELLPWDMWGVMLHPALGSEPIALSSAEVVARLTAADLGELDRVALLASGHVDLPALRRAYEDPHWHVPSTHPALAGVSSSRIRVWRGSGDSRDW